MDTTFPSPKKRINEVFINTDNTETFDKIKKAIIDIFPDAFIAAIDKETSDATIVKVYKKQVKWQEEKNISEYVNKPENLQKAFTLGLAFKKHFDHRYFTVKDVVRTHNMDYKDVKKLIDTLYCFGMLALDEESGTKKYQVILSPDDKIMYLNHCKEKTLKDMLAIDKMMTQAEEEKGRDNVRDKVIAPIIEEAMPTVSPL